jgi:ribonucleoside-diphosphate reductase alpha chain
MATSVIDFVFRVLGMEYLGRTDFVQVKPTKDDDVKMELETSAARERQEKKDTIAVKEIEAKAAPAEKATATSEEDMPKTFAVSTGKGPSAQAGAGGSSSLATLSGGSVVVSTTGAINSQLSGMMGDAPFCDSCGHVTVRNGSCYKCLNCGNSMGCS